MKDVWGDVWSAATEEMETRSWQDVLREDEQHGGASEWGNSRWSDFEECPYRYSIKHVRRLKPVRRDKNLEIGGLVHECLANYYNAYDRKKSDTKNDERCVKAMFDLVDRCSNHVPATAAEARRLLQGWLRVYGPGTHQDDRSATLFVETEIGVNKPFPYSARLDRVVSDGSDGVQIVETKTASMKSQTLLSSYSMNPQFIGQAYLWKKCMERKHGPLTGFQVDLIVKGKEMQFSRETVPITDAAIRDWRKDRQATRVRMLQCEASRHWPRNRNACQNYGRLCSLHAHCALGDRKAMPDGWVRKEKGER